MCPKLGRINDKREICPKLGRISLSEYSQRLLRT